MHSSDFPCGSGLFFTDTNQFCLSCEQFFKGLARTLVLAFITFPAARRSAFLLPFFKSIHSESNVVTQTKGEGFKFVDEP